jgi:hypothetical protein
MLFVRNFPFSKNTFKPGTFYKWGGEAKKNQTRGTPFVENYFQKKYFEN